MSGICDTCQRLKRIGCGLAMDGLESCDMHENESRYDKLFGTPEKVAQTLRINSTLNCDECLLHDECLKTPEVNQCLILDQAALLKWLRSDA